MFYSIITHSRYACDCFYPTSLGYFILIVNYGRNGLGELVLRSEAQNDHNGETGGCAVDRNVLVGRRVGSFRFSSAPGVCFPFSYIAAVIQLESHSWKACSYPPIRKRRQMSNTPPTLTPQIYVSAVVFNAPAVMMVGSRAASHFISQSPLISPAEKSFKAASRRSWVHTYVHVSYSGLYVWLQ